MVELRSGTTTGGDNTRTPGTRDPSIPENIEIASQGDLAVNKGAQLQSPNQNQGQTPTTAQGVYVGGTYPATLTRAAQGSPPYRPPQFAFTTPQPRQSQEEYKSTKSHEDSDESASTRPAPSPKRVFTFEAPMRPLDVARKANMYTWTLIFTGKGKLLTQNFTERTMEDVRAHAQIYQDRGTREAQNSEMFIQCLKASITRSVYNKVYLQREKYIILRKNTFEQVEDGICFLKTIIDNYHSNTRSSTKQIRKQLATLNHYMRSVAKGDVSKVWEH
jgi:hypothetical protein